MLLSQGLAAQSLSHVPIHHWDFGRHFLLLVLQRMQGLAVLKSWAAEVLVVGRAGWSCPHGHGSEWIPLRGAQECLRAGGKR